MNGIVRSGALVDRGGNPGGTGTGCDAAPRTRGTQEAHATMGRKKVLPTAEPPFADEDGSGRGVDLEEEDSGRGLLIAVNKHIINEDDDEEEGDDDEEDSEAPRQREKLGWSRLDVTTHHLLLLLRCRCRLRRAFMVQQYFSCHDVDNLKVNSAPRRGHKMS